MWRSIARIAGAVVVAWTSFAPAQNLLLNGSFTQGSQDATSWDHPAAENNQGGIRGGRDTSVFASPPASLRIEATAGGALGRSAQTINNLSPGSYRVTGKIKVANAKAAGIAMVMFGSAGRQTGWNEVVFATGTTGWTDFDVTTALPPETGTVVFMPYADLLDLGRLWVDDLSFERASNTADRLALLDFSGTAIRSSYNSWAGHLACTDQGMSINATCDGGGNISRWVDVSNMASHVPVLHVRSMPGNGATKLVMTLLDENKAERQWHFTLPSPEAGMMPVLPANFASLSKPNQGNAGPWKMIQDVRLKCEGDPNTPVKLVVRGIEFGAPGQRIGPMATKGTASTAPARQAAASPSTREEIVTMEAMMRYNSGYGSWVGKASNVAGELQVRGGNSQGGVVYHGTWDLTPHKGQMPAMTLRVLPGNQAKAIRFMPEDGSGKTDTYTYDLPAPSDRPVTLLPRNNKKFGDDAGFGLSQVRKYHIQGVYENTLALSVSISKVEYFDASKSTSP